MRRLAVALVLLATPVLAQDTAEEERDRSFLEGVIEDQLSSTARQVQVIGFAGALSSRATVERITVSDRDGVWLEAEDLVLDWNRSALFGRRIEIEEMSAARIAVLRSPVPDAQIPDAQATPFALPDLPVAIQIGRLAAQRIELGAPVLGEALALTLGGTVDLEDGEGSASIQAEMVEGTSGTLELTGAYSNATRELVLDLALQEAEGGLVARALDLPGLPALALTVQGQGPIDGYTAGIALATEGEPRVTGTVQVATTGRTPDGRAAQTYTLDLTGDVTPLVAPELGALLGADLHVAAEAARREDGALALDRLLVEARSLTLTGGAVIGADGWPARLALDGTLADPNGQPVLLPFGGGATVSDGRVLLDYDRTAARSWTLNARLSEFVTKGLSAADVTVTGGGTLVPGTVTADVTATATGLAATDPALGEALGAEITARLVAARDGEGPLVIDRLGLDAPGLALDLAGTSQGPDAGWETVLAGTLAADDLGRFAAATGLATGGAADLDLDLALRPLDGVARVAAVGTTRDLALGLAWLDPYLAGEGTVDVAAARDADGTRVDRLSLVTPQARLTGAANLTRGPATLTLDAALDDLSRAVAGAVGPATIRLSATRDADGLISADGAGELPGGTALSLDATQPTAEAPVDIAAQVRVDDLSVWAALAQRPTLAGAADLTVTGTLVPDDGTAALDVAGTTRDLSLGLAQVDPLLAGEGRLLARVTRDDAATLAVTGLAYDTAVLAVQGDASRRSTGALAANGSAAVEQLGLILPDILGPGRIAGTIGRAPDGTTDLDVTATLPTGTAQVAGRLDPARVFDGAVDLALSDIAPLSPLAGRDLGGAVQGRVEGLAALDLSRLDLTVGLTATNLRVGVPSIEPLLDGTVRLDGTVAREAGGDFAIDATVEGEHVDATAAGALGDAGGAVAFDARLPQVGRIAPGLDGAATATGTATRGTDGATRVVADLTAPGTTASVDAMLGADGLARGTVRADVANLAPFSRLAGRDLRGGVMATLDGSARLDGSALDVAVDATTRDLDPGVAALAPVLRGTGTVTGRVTKDGGALALRGVAARFPNLTLDADATTQGGVTQTQFDARLADVGLFTDQLAGPVTASGTATVEGGATRVDADVTGPGGIAGRIAGTVAPTPDLRITGALPLALLNGALDPRRIEGDAAVELRLAGGYGIANLSGPIRIAGARLTDPALGLAVEGIGGTVTLGGGSAEVALTGGLSGGGALDVRGRLSLAAPYPADLAVTGQALTLRDPSLYEAQGNASLRIAGPLAGGGSVSGRVDLSLVEIRVPTSPNGALGPLPDLTHIAPPPGVRATLARADAADPPSGGGARPPAGGGGGLALDVLVSAPARVFIRGRGLDAELGGSLRLRGTTGSVIPSGAFELIRGRLSILGQRFDLTEGRATLAGNFEPTIDLRAVTGTRGEATVTVAVIGPATQPEVTFSSIPELPQDEVLAQLLFGRSLSSISPLQAVQLAAAAAELAGRGGGGLVEQLRAGTGLADFDLTTDAEGNAALRLGQYLGENVYTDVQVSAESTEATINLDLTPDLTVRAGVADDGDTFLGFEFARDY